MLYLSSKKNTVVGYFIHFKICLIVIGHNLYNAFWSILILKKYIYMKYQILYTFGILYIDKVSAHLMFCPVFCAKNGTFLQHLFAKYVAKMQGVICLKH